MADGRAVYVGFSLANVNALVPQTEDVSVSLTNYEAALDRGEKWLRGQAVTTTDNLHMAQKLWVLGKRIVPIKPLTQLELRPFTE